MSLAPRRWTRLVPGALAALLLTFVLEQSPHLVHHLFDEDQYPDQQSCPFAASGDREPGLASPAAPPLVVLPLLGPAVALVAVGPIVDRPARSAARAPPRLAA